MSNAAVAERHSERAGQRTGVRLAFGALLWRLTVLMFVLTELSVWTKHLANRPFMPPRRKIAIMLFLTPRLFFLAFFLAGAMTIVFDLLLRCVVQPMVRLWINPPVDSELGTFHLEPHEALVATTPARHAVGRRWQPGTLLRTNRRLGFVPHAWDSEPWFVRLADVKDTWSSEPPAWAWGFITGLPERLLVCDRAGQVQTFLVPQPDTVLHWAAAGASP